MTLAKDHKDQLEELQTDGSVRVNFQVIIEGKEAEATSLKFKNFLEKKLNPKVVVKTEDGVIRTVKVCDIRNDGGEEKKKSSGKSTRRSRSSSPPVRSNSKDHMKSKKQTGPMYMDHLFNCARIMGGPW